MRMRGFRRRNFRLEVATDTLDVESNMCVSWPLEAEVRRLSDKRHMGCKISHGR
jgi:hypothetical protein